MASLWRTSIVYEVMFWLCTCLLLYVYAGYPVLLAVLGCLRRQQASGDVAYEPTVTLIVPAYNEEHVIVAKIQNIFTLNYPRGKWNALVACDGCTDRTVQRAETQTDGDLIRVLDFARQGKIKLLTDAMQYADGEIVVISDASVMLDRTALRKLVAHYADPSVAAVSGSYTVAANALEQLYWRYEACLKKKESALGCVCSVHGALYSFRKALYRAPSPRTLNDDDVISLNLLSRGYRVLYEPAAVATDLEHVRMFRQRVRTMAGSLQACTQIKSLWKSSRILPLVLFVSHTVLRLWVPLLLGAMLGLSLFLYSVRPVYLALLALQLAFYGAAIAGAKTQWRSPIARVPYYFCMRHVPIVFAAYHAMFGFRRVKWR
jgi:cellulose synthase/poly-beta-1,6-N-acetylglucosamine synthase-like glycosyltransferase